jgi:pimeloyl-ACP methyl ester carboxylesterase
MRLILAALASLLLATIAFAQAPASPPPPKRIPIPGITLTDNERRELTTGAAALRREIDVLAKELAGNPTLLALLPDVEIFHKAVDWALRYDEFMASREITYARTLLTKGQERVTQLRGQQAPWLTATGLVLRGYRSKLDGSVQPFGLVVPESLTRSPGETPLMVWLLGRGEKRTELAFLAEREAGPSQLVPRNTLILVPYGRFCNATKFAGEADVFEALAAVRAQYRVDANRIAVAGFSMGGGSAWHLATHYPGLWAVASPGAGFAETPIFTKASAPGKEQRPAWEQRLWRQYDATGIARNLFNVPTLAYTGDLDGQKEASDLMEKAMAAEGLKLARFIGPQTAHKYHPETKETLTKGIETALAKGREALPREIRFSTYTLRYPESSWVRIEGMGEHWERADIRAHLGEKNTLTVETKNVTAFSLRQASPSAVIIDGQRLTTFFARGGQHYFTRRDGSWRATAPDTTTVRKRPGLTGPVDDAFVEPFVFVRPSGKPLSPELGTWVESELTAARTLWRDVFRGDAPIKSDRELSDGDIADRNLVLWGDPSSNAIIARIIAQLPIEWNATTLTVRGKTHPANHAPILVFPNPLNPKRYVVINSGITFRADGYGNNALQTPKLPDWSVVDVRTPAGPRWPGRIVDAGFFDEQWK